MNLEWFMQILAYCSSIGKNVKYSLFSEEFSVNYDLVVKPKFSVKLAGYNYGKPKIKGEKSDSFEKRSSITCAN